MEKVLNKAWLNWSFKDLNQKGAVQLAVNAFGNEDSDGDISLPGSFKKTLKENFGRVRWFLNHDVTQLLGVPLKGYETPDYLVMEAQFNLEKQIARDTYEDYKLFAEHGKSLQHSVGLQAIKYEINQDEYIRTVSEWKLWEFSTLTHWGANENTPMLNIKSKDEIKAIIEEMMKNPKYSDQRKHNIETVNKALFVEPSRYTPDQKAAMRSIIENFNFNLII